jgi:drug/metabolite transporter (DMT)-like permease
MTFTSIGAIFGPFLGVSFSLLAVQQTATGIASTIMSIVPVLIIPPAVLVLHERVSARALIGAIAAVAGVALLFL